MWPYILNPKFWPFWLALVFFRILVLFPHAWIMRLGEIIGGLSYRFVKKKREIAEINIRLCFPELSKEEQDNLVKRAMINTTKGFLEMAFCWWASDTRLEKITKVEGLDILEKYKKEGRGVILIGMHYTTIEIAGSTMGLRKKVDITYKEQKGELLPFLMDKYRQRNFTELIEKQAMRTMVRNLRNGHVIWYAPDQDFGRPGSVFAPFFGTPAATITTLGKLVKMTNAKVLMFSHFRYDTDSGSQYIGKVIDPYGEDFNDDDVHNATLMNKGMEDLIRQHPDQYNWMHKRFRTRPNRSDPKYYPSKKKRQKKQ